MRFEQQGARGSLAAGLKAWFIGASLLGAGAAQAWTPYSQGEWSVQWDNSLSYGLGIRAQGIDPAIGNNPVLQNSEYRFDHVGSLVTNRLGILTELAIRRGNDFGLRLSADAWKDFAYDNQDIKYNPALAFLSSGNPSGKYSGYIDKYYGRGGQLDDAFAYGNFEAGTTPVQVKIGRLTEFWGNALFAGFQSISYSQSPLDVIKGTTAPGSQIKELFLPRAQLSVHSQLSSSVAVAGEYFLEWRATRLPEGGTYLGIVDPAFYGPQSLEGQVPRGPDQYPTNKHDNFGLSLKWTPPLELGTLGFYYRHFDESMPYSPILVGIGAEGPYYHLSFARDVRLYGLSLDKNVGPASLGVEASYRRNTALFTGPASVSKGDGARGNTLNFVINGIYGLTPTPLYNTGSAVLELSWTRVLAVTANADLYDAEGYKPCSGLGRIDGCATHDNVAATFAFDSQWLQVFPGVDLDMPLTVNFGILGNGQYLGTAFTGNDQGTVAYTAGVQALLRQRYSVKLAYNGYHAQMGHRAPANAGAGPYNPTGNGLFMWNDKGWVSLTLKATF